MGDIQSNGQLETPEDELDGLYIAADQAEVLASVENDTSTMGGLSIHEWDYQQPKRGEIRTGVILNITDQEIIVDVGAKRDGIVPFADLQRMDPDAVSQLRVGDKVPVCVLRPEDQDGNLTVSLYQARQEKDWQRAKELADSSEVWEGSVIGYNKGGLVIPLGGIRGFLPASQVADFKPNMTPEERLARLAEMVGETLMVKVIEINRRKHRLILSATVAQREWRQRQRERLLDELREGEVRRGTVSSLCPFGAFVDLGGADGLIHLSELSWRRLRHPKEVLHIGEEVDVLVLKLDRDNNRIGLSRKRLQPEPWAVIEDNYELGQLVEGLVTNVVDFGAFAEIEPGVEGLVHVSELTEQSITHPRDVLRKGDQVLLRVIRIDTRRKRLGLSLKRVLESERNEWEARVAATRPPRPPRPAREERAPMAVQAQDEGVEEDEYQAAHEAEYDAEYDAEYEGAGEAELEGGAEVEYESADVAEAEYESAGEAEPESVAEAESAAETEPEGVPEAEYESAGEAEPESVAEAESAGETEPEGVPEAEYESAGETEPESVAEAEYESAGEAEPESVAEAGAESAGETEQDGLAEAEVEYGVDGADEPDRDDEKDAELDLSMVEH